MYKYKNLFVTPQINFYIYTFGMEISGKGIENLFMNNMMLKFLLKKKQSYEKKLFHTFLLGN